MPSKSTPRPTPSSARTASRSKSSAVGPPHPQADLQPDLQKLPEIDAQFEQAGLVRNRRGKPAGVARRARFQQAMPEELSPAPAIPRVAANGVEWLSVPGWDKKSWLWNGFSTRRGGVSRTYCPDDAPGELNLGFTPDDDRENVVRNRQLLAEAVSGSATTPLVTVRQIHSNVLVVIGVPSDRSSSQGWKAGVPSDRSSSQGWKGDGLMTDEPGLLLGIQTADCIPVLVADRKRKAVAAFHAGWRGTVQRIVESGIGRMRLQFRSEPEDLIAAIGPGIGSCCYAVGEEVLSAFDSQFTYAPELFREVYSTDPVRTKYPMLFLTQRAPGHSPIGPSLHVNLIEANRRQLLAAGLKPGSIQMVGGCTSCQPQMFFSHRASKGRAGRMLSVIGIRGK